MLKELKIINDNNLLCLHAININNNDQKIVKRKKLFIFQLHLLQHVITCVETRQTKGHFYLQQQLGE